MVTVNLVILIVLVTFRSELLLVLLLSFLLLSRVLYFVMGSMLMPDYV